MNIPSEHHKFILGKGGNNLKQLEANTGTRINISKNADLVTVVGIKEEVEKACHEIQCISDKKVNLCCIFSSSYPNCLLQRPFGISVCHNARSLKNILLSVNCLDNCYSEHQVKY